MGERKLKKNREKIRKTQRRKRCIKRIFFDKKESKQVHGCKEENKVENIEEIV